MGNDEPKRQFTEEELAEARKQAGEILEHDGGDFLEVGVSGPLTVHGTPAATASTSVATTSAPSRMGKRKQKPQNAAAATQAPVVENPWETMDRIPDASERREDSHSRVSLADPTTPVVNTDTSSKA